ncbi:MAG: hypothetical protein FJX47_21640, partial [Alphaproteobacteria bacterium]|nr:hypothetical protein [Alphaproteobacteria bacterium]
MHEARWTPSRVSERLDEAADTLRRLPEARVPGYAPTWPEIIRNMHEAYGLHAVRLRREPPEPGAIDRMHEVFTWLAWLAPDDARLVWLRACDMPWKPLCWRLGASRATLWRRWVSALLEIAR